MIQESLWNKSIVYICKYYPSCSTTNFGECSAIFYIHIAWATKIKTELRGNGILFQIVLVESAIAFFDLYVLFYSSSIYILKVQV